MAVMNVFKTTTTADSPLDASAGTEAKPAVSDFVTVQSFTNFAAMTGAITALHKCLRTAEYRVQNAEYRSANRINGSSTLSHILDPVRLRA